jgi:hypothetical protein
MKASLSVVVAGDSESREKIRSVLAREGDLQIKLLAEAATLIEAIELIGKLRPDVVVVDLELCGGEKSDRNARSAQRTMIGSRLLVIPLWSDFESQAPRGSSAPSMLLEKGRVASEFVPLMKRYKRSFARCPGAAKNPRFSGGVTERRLINERKLGRV